MLMLVLNLGSQRPVGRKHSHYRAETWGCKMSQTKPPVHLVIGHGWSPRTYRKRPGSVMVYRDWRAYNLALNMRSQNAWISSTVILACLGDVSTRQLTSESQVLHRIPGVFISFIIVKCLSGRASLCVSEVDCDVWRSFTFIQVLWRSLVGGL